MTGLYVQEGQLVAIEMTEDQATLAHHASMEVHHGDVVEELVGLDAFRESNQAFADLLGPHAFALLEIRLDAAGVEHRSILTVRLAETIRVENEVITEPELDRVLCPRASGSVPRMVPVASATSFEGWPEGFRIAD